MAEELKLITVEKKPEPPKPATQGRPQKEPPDQPRKVPCQKCKDHPGKYHYKNGHVGVCYPCGGSGEVTLRAKTQPRKKKGRPRKHTVWLMELVALLLFVALLKSGALSWMEVQWTTWTSTTIF